MGPSDFPERVCLSRLCGSAGILVGVLTLADKKFEDLPG
jgi:hypothetical protein